ncbi:MAG TPA: low specificity L-threonine aldolase, partial [Clostridiaceae bacterium]|nr:low specificity L-threonine aldolase [Clostridiaceae bacterium]
MTQELFFSFANDYSEGCHPRILERLQATNFEQTSGYGTDAYCESAAKLIKDYFDCDDHEVYFFVGGTPVNLTVMAAFLKPWQGVIAADTGHIEAHESGAVEGTGHKVLTLPNRDGKLTAADVRRWCETFYADETHEHMVYPGMIYISQPTELGTLYTKDELQRLRTVADEYHLPIFMDGARLAMALAAIERTELKPTDYASYVDLFYVGGTKCGALFGEALIVSNQLDQMGFRTVQKQRVGRLAKGRLLGLQFLELFNDNLYLSLGRHANTQANLLTQGLKDIGVSFSVDSPTNQLFPILPDAIIPQLRKNFGFEVQGALSGERHVVRFVTSWATRNEAITCL